MTDHEHENSKCIPMNDGLIGFAMDASAQIAADLGESPEAWRGAGLMAHLIKSGVMAELQASIEAEGEPSLSDIAQALLFTVALMERYPTWDFDAAGPACAQFIEREGP